MNRQASQPWRWLSAIAIGALLIGGCVAPTSPGQASNATHAGAEVTAMSDLAPIELDGGKLRVVATTNIVGDVVAQIGGNHIELATLLAPGVDPHAYQLAPSDRQLLEDAHVIFINGLGLEEGMLPVLDELDNRVPVVSVNRGVATLEFGEHEHAPEHAEEHEEDDHEEHESQEEPHHHEGADPHTWQSVPNVIVWTENIATTLSALDPAQADAYAATAATYRAELEALDRELHALVDTLPAAQRKLVTDHDSLGYLAHEYDFRVVGIVIPSLSTLAATSAQELAALQTQISAEGIHTLFIGSTVSSAVGDQLATDLGIKIVPLYTDSLSDATGPAATYVDFMRFNLQAIVSALR